MARLDGKVAVITGGASGIGAACARRFAEAGSGVAVFDMQEPTGDGGQSRIEVTSGVVRNVRGGLPWMRIDAVMQLVDIRFDGAGGWSDLMGLRGRVRALEYDVGAGRPRSATIELRQAGVSIPIDAEEERLGRGERYLTFESVDGTVRMTRDRLEEVSDGRIFTGRQALALGLIDGLGDYEDAVDLAKRLAGLDEDAMVVGRRRRRFSLLEMLVRGVDEVAAELAPWPALGYRMP